MVFLGGLAYEDEGTGVASSGHQKGGHCSTTINSIAPAKSQINDTTLVLAEFQAQEQGRIEKVYESREASQSTESNFVL